MQNNFKEHYPQFVGALSAILMGIIIYLLGHLSGYKAKILIEQTLDNFSMVCNTVSLASATILALLLTALSTSVSSDFNIKKKHYKKLISLTTIVTLTFIASLFSFLILLVPITESENIDSSSYNYFYWLMLLLHSVLVGLMITIALMLRRLIITMTEVTALDGIDHELVEDEENPS